MAVEFCQMHQFENYLFHDNRKWKSIGKFILCGYYCIGPEDAVVTPKVVAQQ
jgi:hypothetical protein